jgi:hypothetical protein
MGSAVERLLQFVERGDPYLTPHADLLPLQLEAANERLQSRIGKIKLLANRAATGGVSSIAKPADLIPLLFAHTTYKSYAESWLTEGRWDRMCKWLDTVSAFPTQGIDLEGVTDLDAWVDRLESVGHYVTCSSGTTGKPAILTCSAEDLEISGRTMVQQMAWALKITPKGDYRIIGLGGASKAARTQAITKAILNAFSTPDKTYQNPSPPITVGQIVDMIRLRRKIADGSATPSEIAGFEAESARRQQNLDTGVGATLDAIIDGRGDKLLIMGMWAMLYMFAEQARAKGYSAKDFRPENRMMVAGGLKGANVPANYKEIIYETFNLGPERNAHGYSMQEINTTCPMCSAGRYHVPPWLMLLILNDSGEELLDTSGGGEIEGRAAFFDISADARWGGIISGDRIKVDYGKCACGHEGPTVATEIVRFADLASGDKIACSGTIDAYVRGVA